MRVQSVSAGRIGGKDLTALRGRRAAPPAPPLPDDLPRPLLQHRPAADRRELRRRVRGHTQGFGRRAARATRTAELLELVGLGGAFAGRYPHELSEGQHQRVGIARALAVSPDLVVCYKPISALDVSSRPRSSTCWSGCSGKSVSPTCTSHELAIVQHVADRVAVMYLGKLVELGSADEVYEHPRHP
jgi:peptide/nickel transport system ATP-binding protein/oligopeptide transport system ATP-binding protein